MGRADRRLLFLATFLLSLTLGAARMDRALASDLARWAGRRDAEAQGVVLEQRGKGTYLVRVSEPARGVAILYARPGSKLRYGDLVGIRGTPVRDPQLEPYERGLARTTGAALVFREPAVDILDTDRAGRVGQTLSKLRFRLSLLLERHIPAEYSPLAEGLLLGGSLGLDPDLKEDFQRSGISHILAASGYNVTVFAWLLLVLLKPLLGARRSLPPALLAILLYVGVAGFSASVVRAGLMGGIGVTGTWLGRPRDSARALVAAALLMTLWHPGTAFDIGAQLSFAATAGLIWLYPVVLRGLGRLPRPLAEASGVTLTAQLTTMPLSLYYFGGLSVWALVANLIVAPLVPAGMLLAALTLIGGGLWYPLGQLLGWLTGSVLAAIAGVAQAASALPGSNLQTDEIGLAPVLLYYAAIAAAVWLQAANNRRFLQG